MTELGVKDLFAHFTEIHSDARRVGKEVTFSIKKSPTKLGDRQNYPVAYNVR